MEYAKQYFAGRMTISGNKVEFKEYSVPVLAEPRKHSVTRHYTEHSEKRNDNLFRARKTVRQRIWANIEPHSKFLTLTTTDTVLDVKAFKRRLTTFFQAMKREGFELKYLYVLERQKERGLKEGNEGSIHAHIIIFNDEYIPFDVINKHWNGLTDIHMLDGLRMENGEKIRDAGAYICKYITKEANLEWGSKCFACSKGLKKPAEIPVKIYGDGKGQFFKEENLDELFNGFMDMCDITYQDAQVIRYCGSDGVITQIIDYKQGNFNYSKFHK